MSITTESDFQYRDLHCLVIAQDMGHRCGYVGVPFDLGRDLDVDVHGGLTYSGKLESDLYYYGFDCAHSGDGRDESIMSEEYKKIYSNFSSTSDVVRTKEYVEDQCRYLADQLVPLIKVAQHKKQLVEEILQ